MMMQKRINTKATSSDAESTSKQEELVVSADDRAVWRTLESPVRMRLLELIRRLEACTILELSEAAGTNPVNLYYHVRALESAKLIRSVGRREGVARRAPVIYAASFDEITIEFDPDNPAEVEKIQSLQKSWYREAQDCMEQDGLTKIEGTEFALRWEYLNRQEREEIASMMTRIAQLLDHKRDQKAVDETDDQQLVFVGMQIAKCSSSQVPTPRVSIVPKAEARSAGSELRDNVQSVAQTA